MNARVPDSVAERQAEVRAQAQEMETRLERVNTPEECDDLIQKARALPDGDAKTDLLAKAETKKKRLQIEGLLSHPRSLSAFDRALALLNELPEGSEEEQTAREHKRFEIHTKRARFEINHADTIPQAETLVSIMGIRYAVLAPIPDRVISLTRSAERRRSLLRKTCAMVWLSGVAILALPAVLVEIFYGYSIKPHAAFIYAATNHPVLSALPVIVWVFTVLYNRQSQGIAWLRVVTAKWPLKLLALALWAWWFSITLTHS